MTCTVCQHAALTQTTQFYSVIPLGQVWRWLKEDDIKGMREPEIHFTVCGPVRFLHQFLNDDSFIFASPLSPSNYMHAHECAQHTLTQNPLSFSVAVGGGHVVVLYPPDGDQALLVLVCRLGSSLQALGFSVSLDLWSQAELGVLGPVPWLHSRLDRLQRQGGKVVLILTHTAWERAVEWGSRGWERDVPRKRNREAGEEEEPESGCCASTPYSDVFSASLSCILADYLQGRAGERFVLVQFESMPPQPTGCSRPLPELFRGLQLFSLPSQSLGFLTELAVGGRGASSSGRRRRAGGLRVASRALAGGLRGFTAGSTVLHLAGLSQDCVGVGAEDPWETVPLQPYLTAPPSSPDSCPKASGMEWV